MEGCCGCLAASESRACAVKRRVLFYLEAVIFFAVVLIGYVQGFANAWRWLASLF